MEPLRPWLVPFLLPEHCFDQFFLRFQLLDGAGGASGGGVGAFRGFSGGFERDFGAPLKAVGAAAILVTGGSCEGRRHLGFGRGKTPPPFLFWP